MVKFAPAWWAFIALFCALQSVAEELVVPHQGADSALGEAIQLSEIEIEREAEIERAKEIFFSGVRPETTEPILPANASASVSGFTVDRSSRNDVLSLYHRVYLASEGFEGSHGWTGDVDTCVAGDMSVDFRNHTLRRINYYRAMAGLSTNIFFNATKNAKAQQAALIMAREQSLSHFPDVHFPSNPCLTADGIEAAGASNISLGNYGPNAVEGQLIDDGGNNSAVGHRRWLLYSRAQEMGTGDIPGDSPNYSLAANAIWVIGNFTSPPAQSPEIMWPPEGFVPYHLAPNDSQTFARWSFGYPGANFSNATVTMSVGGQAIGVVQEAVQNGFADNTLVWRPSGIPSTAPTEDVTYRVSITGIGNAPFSSRVYDVTLIDPFRLNDEITVTGPNEPGVGQANAYTFNSVSGVDSYQVCVATHTIGSWTEGAEAAPTPAVVDGTDPSYSLISGNQSATGSNSFHLATPGFNLDDFFVVDRDLVASSGSQVQFKYRRMFMHPQTKLRIQISRDEGQSFRTIDTIDGNNTGSSLQWDPASFLSHSTSIPSEYWNRPIRIRFMIETTGVSFIGSNSSNGIYIDDVSVSQHREFTCIETQDLADDATGFSFSPGSPNTEYFLMVKPSLGGRFWEYSPVFEATSANPVPSLSVADITTTEDASHVTFMIQLSEVSSSTVTVDFATADGTALADIDYLPQNGQRSFSPGQSTMTVEVPLIHDSENEGDESFQIALTNPSNATIADANAIATITDVASASHHPTFSAFVNAYRLSGTLSADTDLDGSTDFAEWAWGGTNPRDGNARPSFVSELRDFSGSEYLTMSYLRLSGGTESASEYHLSGLLSYRGVGSASLHQDDLSPIHVGASSSLPVPPDGYEWGCLRFPSSVDSTLMGFLKLELESAP